MSKILKIVEIKIYCYSLPLVRSLRIGGRDVCARGGIVVEVVDDRGVRGLVRVRLWGMN
jgi:hypothetical protein